MKPPVKLSAAEQKEADDLLKELTHRVREVDALSRYIDNFHSYGNIDVLRCLDRLLTVVEIDLFIDIDICSCIVVEYTDLQAAELLTADMLTVYRRVRTAFNMLPTSFNADRDKFAAYVFQNMNQAEDIMFLLEHRGITDPNTIAAQVEGLGIERYAESLRDGVL
jgi:hypothetical protein